MRRFIWWRGRDARSWSAQAPAACIPAESAAHRKRPHTSPSSARSNGDVLGTLASNRPTECYDSERAGDDPKDVSAAPQTKMLKAQETESAETLADEPYLQQLAMSYDTMPDVALHGPDAREATEESVDMGENGLSPMPAENDGSDNSSLAARPICLCVRSPAVEPPASAIARPSLAGAPTLPLDFDVGFDRSPPPPRRRRRYCPRLRAADRRPGRLSRLPHYPPSWTA